MKPVEREHDVETAIPKRQRPNIPLLKAHMGKSLAPGFCPLQHLRRVIQAGDLRLRHFPIEGHGQYAGTHGDFQQSSGKPLRYSGKGGAKVVLGFRTAHFPYQTAHRPA